MLGAAAAAQASAASAFVASLREAAAQRGLVYGAQAYEFPPVFSSEFDRLVVQQCGLLAPKLNWTLVSPREGEFVQNPDRGVVAFARARRIPLTGACPIWFQRVPDWFRALPDGKAQARALEQFIFRIGARYSDSTWSINVVNEALNPADGRPDGLRRDAFSELLGATYIDLVFRAARAAFPHSLLVYNDYGMEQEEGDMRPKRRALLGLLDAMLRAGTPIDAVGLQAHLSLGRPFNAADFGRFLREIAARRLRIVISELDVLDVAGPTDLQARDAAVADMYRRFLEVSLDEIAVAAVVTWGLSDRYTWLTRQQSRRFARADGLPNRPLPFDADFRPKAAFHALVTAFQAAPVRAG